jgi:hypothetical protein
MSYSTKNKCYEQVDVDNCFGTIMDDDIWCNKHQAIGRAYKLACDIIDKQQVLEKQERKLSEELQKPLRLVRDSGLML